MLLVLGECNNNFSAAERRYSEKFPDRTPHSRHVFERLAKRVREKGIVQPDHNKGKKILRPAREGDNAIDVLAAATVDPTISTRKIALELDQSRSTVWRILNNEKWHPYHINLHQQLSLADHANRVAFCEWLLNQHVTLCEEIVWSDEAMFKSNGEVNLHNAHYWSDRNPHWLREVDNQHVWSLNVWCGIVGDRIIGPFFFDGTLTGLRYAEFLRTTIAEVLDELPLALVRNMWLQQDGCPAHWHRMARAAADLLFPGKWIGRGGPVAWPARSPDLTPLDFFLWGVIKDIVYRQKPTTREDMKGRICEAIRSLDPAQIRRATRSVRKRAQKCVKAQGQHFEHKL